MASKGERFEVDKFEVVFDDDGFVFNGDGFVFERVHSSCAPLGD